MRKNKGLGLGLLAMQVLFGLRPAISADALYLSVGAQRTVDLPAAVTRIVIGEAGIVEASVQNEHLVEVTALKPGHTTMSVFTADTGQGISYSINVGGAAHAAAPAQPSAGAVLARAMAADPDLRGIGVRTQADKVVLSGQAPSVEAHARAASLAAAASGDKVVDLTTISGNQMVAVEIRFAAVASNTVNELGFNFASLGGGFQGATTAPSTVTGYALNGTAPGLGGAATKGLSLASGLPISSAFNLFLSSAKGNFLGILSALNAAGLTELLAQPTLVVRSGETASFLAGGEVPIPVPQGGSATGAVTIDYHPYGVRLEVSPTVLSDRRISLRVSPEVSEIDTSNGLQLDGYSVPAFRKRSTSTTVELGDSESYVIAGLIYNTNSNSENRVPLLGDLPIIGSFFKLAVNTRQRQELIVIATPHLVRPIDARTLPPLPGEEANAAYNPGAGQMLLNTRSLGDTIAAYGLLR
jgi:pilus assembly protein CpaC